MSDTLHKDISDVSLNLKEIEIIKHTLGYDYRNEAFRNHFCTRPTSDDGVICEGLVAKGLMTNQGSNPNLIGGDCCYYTCTDVCKELIKKIGGYKK